MAATSLAHSLGKGLGLRLQNLGFKVWGSEPRLIGNNEIRSWKMLVTLICHVCSYCVCAWCVFMIYNNRWLCAISRTLSHSLTLTPSHIHFLTHSFTHSLTLTHSHSQWPAMGRRDGVRVGWRIFFFLKIPGRSNTALLLCQPGSVLPLKRELAQKLLEVGASYGVLRRHTASYVRIRAPGTTFALGGTIFADDLLNAALRKNPSLRFRTSDYSPPG